MLTANELMKAVKVRAVTGKSLEEVIAENRANAATTIEPPVNEIPYEVVKRNYTLPFDLYPYQQNTVNTLAPLPAAGYYLDMGTGKSYTSLVSALYKVETGEVEKIVIIMPPILIEGWQKAIEVIPELKSQVVKYKGTPTERRKINLGSHLITLVGLQIFKQEYSRFDSVYNQYRTMVILDEATSIKNVSTQSHKKVTDFAVNKHIALLTGSPLSSPEDGYAYIKMVSPGTYRNKSHFMSIHAGVRDFFNKVTQWNHLDKLNDNLKLNSKRILKQDVISELPDVTYSPIHYDLLPKHWQLYKQLAEEQLLMFDDGTKLDATSTSKLYHSLGQVICNYDYFSGDPAAKSTAYDLIDEVMADLNGQKLVIFANYKMTNRSLLSYLQKYNPVAVYGGNTGKTNNANIDKFIADPTCQVLIGQPSSMGYGVDGLQKVCTNGLFLEIPPLTAFHQAVARLHRVGQKSGVVIQVAVANKTLQVKQKENLLDNDALVNKVVRNVGDLRAYLFGV